MNDISDNWGIEKPYIVRQLTELKDSMDSITAKLAEIETELRSYKRAAQFLIGLGSFVGLVIGWFAKAMGKS